VLPQPLESAVVIVANRRPRLESADGLCNDSAAMRRDPAIEAEHDAVRQRLAVRVSTTHFAHAAVALFFSSLVAGAGIHLWWSVADATENQLLFCGSVAAVGCSYAIARLVLGWRELKVEVTHLEKLMSLRRSLGLDDPNLLLP
jgi:hypothetical protein